MMCITETIRDTGDIELEKGSVAKCNRSFLLQEFPQTVSCGSALQEKNDRNPDGKRAVLGLMAEQIDSRKGSQAATQDSGEKKGLFRDPPYLMDGFPLIEKHKDET